MNLKDLQEGILTGNSTALARGVTLLESEKAEDWKMAKELLSELKGQMKASRRVGFTGPPGVGKSTFIEKMGMRLVEAGEKVAVLAVDPSSGQSGGSILGDKTRMESLSRHPLSFVRPSPSRGHLGGVTSSLPGVILLCEAAGYPWVLIESVGVGQSEFELSQLVDVFTLIAQPGAGDELQAIKKGILEYVDLIAINKVDVDPKLVQVSRQQYLSAMKVLGKAQVPVVPCSAIGGAGLEDVLDFLKKSPARREQFNLHWFRSLILSEFQKRIRRGQWGKKLSQMESRLENNQDLPTEVVDEFFAQFMPDLPKS